MDKDSKYLNYDPCICCCFPCLFIISIIEKLCQSCCICFLTCYGLGESKDEDTISTVYPSVNYNNTHTVDHIIEIHNQNVNLDKESKEEINL